MDEQLLTANEVAERMRQSIGRFYNFCAEKRREGHPIPRLCVPGLGNRYRWSEIVTWLEQEHAKAL